MLSPVATFRALRGAAERLACDVVTEVEPRPGGQASAVFVLPPSSASRARIGRESPTGPSTDRLRRSDADSPRPQWPTARAARRPRDAVDPRPFEQLHVQNGGSSPG